jgi:uncharacterized membrane protein YgcG
VQALCVADSTPLRRYFLRLTAPYSDRDLAGGSSSEINEQGFKLAMLAALERDGSVEMSDITPELETQSRETGRKGFVDMFLSCAACEVVCELKVFSPHYCDDDHEQGGGQRSSPTGDGGGGGGGNESGGGGGGGGSTKSVPSGTAKVSEQAKQPSGRSSPMGEAALRAAREPWRISDAKATSTSARAHAQPARPLWWSDRMTQAADRARRIRQMTPEQLGRVRVSPYPKDSDRGGGSGRDSSGRGGSGRGGSGRSSGGGSGRGAADGGQSEREWIPLCEYLEQIERDQTMRYVENLRTNPRGRARLDPEKLLIILTGVWIAGATYWLIRLVPPPA